MSSQPDPNVLADLVARCLDLADSGTAEISYEEICADHPELIDEVKSSVEMASGLPTMHAKGPGTDALMHTLLAGRYRVNSRLGAGAMGVVYAATDLDLGRPVAVKVVHTGLLERSTAMERFEREAAALAAIRHESVVTIYDRGLTDQGFPFLVMEEIDGISCSEILERAAEEVTATDNADWIPAQLGLDEVQESSYLRQVVRWTADLASGLEAAHQAGVYHRDIKPSNIMIRRDGRPVLLDFGIAARDDQATLTRTDAAVGTPSYMAPESLLGKAKARPSLDVYGLSATLYHMLTLKAPYRGTPSEVLTALATREPEPAFKARPGLPRDAQAILDHGMSRAPGGRYPSAAALEQDLRNLLAFQPVSVRPTSTVTRAVRKLRRSKLFLGALVATTVIATAFGLRELRDLRMTRREEASRPFQASLPPNLGIVTYANRVFQGEGNRDWVLQQLDGLVNSQHEPVVAHTLRAAFRLDDGDVHGARTDMAAVARVVGTTYARALATRYEELPDSAIGVKGLDVADLPRPSSSDDIYLSGYHELRQQRYGDSASILLNAGLNGNRHARELRLALQSIALNRLPANELGQQAIFDAADQLLAEVEKIVADFGGQSATTYHYSSAAYLRQNRERLALEACDHALKLCPIAATTLQNGCTAAWRRGELEQAIRFAERGLTITPGYLKLQIPLVRALRDVGRTADARTALKAASFPRSSYWKELQLEEHARIVLEEALIANTTGDLDRVRRCLDEAHATLSQLPEDSDARTELSQYANGIGENGSSHFFFGIVDGLTKNPLSALRLRDLPDYWPEKIGSAESEALREWVIELSRTLDNQRLVAQERSENYEALPK